LVVELVPEVPLLPLVPVLVPVPAPEPMPVPPEPMLPEPVLELPGVVVLGLVLEPELDVPLALSRRHWSFCVPVSRSQFWLLLPETLPEEVLGALVEEELLGEALAPELLLGEVLDDELLGEALDPALVSVLLDGVPTLDPVVLPEPLVLGVALVLPEPTLEPDDPMLPLLDDCANAVAEIASSAALTAALRTLKFMLAPSKVEKSLQRLMSKRCAVARGRPPKRLREHRHERIAVRAASAHALGIGPLRELEERRKPRGGAASGEAVQRPARIGLQHRRVDVTLSAYGFSVAQLLRDQFDRGADMAFGLRGGTAARHAPQRFGGLQGPGPSAEILAREIFAGDLLQVGVDVRRLDAAVFAGFIDVLKKLVSGKILHAAHDPGNLPVRKLDIVLHAALAAKPELQRGAPNTHLTVAQGRKPEGLVIACVLLVSNPDAARLEKPHDGGERLFAREPGKTQIARDAPVDFRQRLCECKQPAVLRLIADFAPAAMVAILLSPARVAPCRLHVPILLRADPHVRPRRRNRQ
jgi:hypothetical protein